MQDLMAGYDCLREGKDLSADVIASIRTVALQAHQLAALGFRLCKKGGLTGPEKDLLSSICRNVPEAAAYFSELFQAEDISETLSPTAARKGPEFDRQLTLLKLSSRCEHVGRTNFRDLISDFLSEKSSAVFLAVWLTKVCYDGLSDSDVVSLTQAMRDSGSIHDYRNLRELDGRRIIRRYPTGALSEKISLILPSLLCAFCRDFPIASPFLVARSLGFTGGTWDKLSSIPGFTFPEQGDQTINVMRNCGVAMSVTHGDFNPADRKLYQLRSVTGTIESRELIVSSIASKQLGIPANRLLLDVRFGPGSFIGSKEEAEITAGQMLHIMNGDGVPCFATFTDTLQPNGMAVGNALEVLEALAVMGIDPGGMWDERALLEQRTLVISSFAKLMSAEFPPKDESWWQRVATDKFGSGEVFQAFLRLLRAHGVPDGVLQALPVAPKRALLGNTKELPVLSDRTGRVCSIDQRSLGHFVNFQLGGGGNEYGASFVPTAGIVLSKRLTDTIAAGEPLCRIYVPEELVHRHLEFESEVRRCFGFC